MSKLTGNYNLIMPELTDSPPDITVMNSNWQRIDIKMKEQEEKITETVNLVSNINTNISSNVKNTVLTGLSTAINGAISATDTILAALGKLQVQITSLGNTKANSLSPTFTGMVALPSTTSIGNVSATEIGYVDGVTSAIQTQLNTKAQLTSPALNGTPTIGGNIAYHAGNITISASIPESALAEGYQHQVY